MRVTIPLLLPLLLLLLRLRISSGLDLGEKIDDNVESIDCDRIKFRYY